ncbi:hypothetical protein TNCV_1636451 [Trichonephila clavipes]|uniref:Uncharacterized protein n=1 Tax=Trichonephila clavipes TaxID=2585209 RepID=A0A8X6V0L7_TRICX|nr:hypothetical protein TNCV_1636451 [Trichonephila clavipes]
MNSDDVQGLLDSRNQELKMDEFVEINTRTSKTLNNLSLNTQFNQKIEWRLEIRQNACLIEKGLQVLENTDSNEERIFFLTKQGIRKLLIYYQEILREKKIALSRQRLLC